MKQLALAAILLVVVNTASFAQDVTTTTTSILFQDPIITCPGETIPQPVLTQADLVLDFRDLDDVLVVPSGSIEASDTGIVIRTTEIRIACTAPDEVATLVDRSPTTALNRVPARDENLEGLAESQAGYAVVDTDTANLRSCAAPTCSVVGLVDGGDSLIVLGRNLDESWWYVRQGNLTGWVWADLLVLRGDLSDTPFVRTAGETTQPSLYVGFTGNPIFEGINGTGAILCTVLGDRFNPLLGRTRGDNWYFIEALCEDGRTVQGWISADTGLVRNTGLVSVPIITN